MKYVLLIAILFTVAGCANFSVFNPNPNAVYNYDSGDCCTQGNEPRF